MIFETIFLSIAIIGFGYSAYLDLRYTEFPDWLPYSIIVAAVISRTAYYLSVFGLTQTALYSIGVMLGVGLVFLGFGLLLYHLKQWGDGDAWLLGGLGFLFPESSPFAIYAGNIAFPLIIVFNFFIISLIYMIAYSAVLGVRNKDINKEFMKIMKEKRTYILSMIVALFAFFTASNFFLIHYSGIRPSVPMLILPFFLSAMIIFFNYAKAIEKKAFRKRIDVKELKEGDVVMDGKWVGVTAEDIKKLQKKGGKIWIKEGVRFAPVFILAVIATLLLGNIMTFLVF
ncbi:MAG: hypothetical protein GXO64_01175 [Candidatus Micrarchaeota archaeon]|nr:hypothetical protein [Candidatus Micrarchaeota archaeon]